MLGVFLGSVGHRLEIHKITRGTGKERGDLELKDYRCVINSYGISQGHIGAGYREIQEPDAHR